MIDLLLSRAVDPDDEVGFLQELVAHVAAVRASARAVDRDQVALMESAIARNPEGAFFFDGAGAGTLRYDGSELPVGRFETPSISILKARAAARQADSTGRVRLCVLAGESPATDIGSLQASAGPGTLFQVASQFNCLESPGPFTTPVSSYFSDPTQGPRASISAFTATLLRHYAAPRDDGRRFVQSSDGPQLNLLADLCSAGVAEVSNGYLTSSSISDRAAFTATLARQFDDIRVGVHDDVPVLMGYNWDGAVAGDRRIGQVFTSTFAGGFYSDSSGSDYAPICRSLLRAAYLGTLLAAAALERPKVVLTLIGGGAFGNPMKLIWESICWAISEVEPLLSGQMDVVVNGRNIEDYLRIEDLMPVVRKSGGVVVAFGRSGSVEVSR
jgi:hypothetical protein